MEVTIGQSLIEGKYNGDYFVFIHRLDKNCTPHLKHLNKITLKMDIIIDRLSCEDYFYTRNELINTLSKLHDVTSIKILEYITDIKPSDLIEYPIQRFILVGAL